MKQPALSAFLRTAKKLTVAVACTLSLSPVAAKAGAQEYGDNPLEAEALELSKGAIEDTRFLWQNKPEQSVRCIAARAKLFTLETMTTHAKGVQESNLRRNPNALETALGQFEVFALDGLYGYTAAQIDEKCRVMEPAPRGSAQERAMHAAQGIFKMVRKPYDPECGMALNAIRHLTEQTGAASSNDKSKNSTLSPETKEALFVAGQLYRNCMGPNWLSETKSAITAEVGASPDSFYKAAERMRLSY